MNSENFGNIEMKEQQEEKLIDDSGMSFGIPDWSCKASVQCMDKGYERHLVNTVLRTSVLPPVGPQECNQEYFSQLQIEDDIAGFLKLLMRPFFRLLITII